MNAAFDPSENLIHGEWKTDAGTLGKFVLANTSVPITMPQNPAPAIAAPPTASASAYSDTASRACYAYKSPNLLQARC